MADSTRVTSLIGDCSPESVRTVRANLLNRKVFPRRRTPSIPRARRQRQRRERQAGVLRSRSAVAAWGAWWYPSFPTGFEETRKSQRKLTSAPLSGTCMSDDPEIAEILTAWLSLSAETRAAAL